MFHFYYAQAHFPSASWSPGELADSCKMCSFGDNIFPHPSEMLIINIAQRTKREKFKQFFSLNNNNKIVCAMKSGESNLNRIVMIVQCNFIGGNDVVEGKIVKSFSSSKKLFCAQIIEIIARKQFRARKLRVEEIMGKVSLSPIHVTVTV